MTTVTALYSTPADVEAFEAHYLSTHAPLVDAVPGLVRQESARSTGTPDGSPAPAQDATELAARTGCTLTLLMSELD